MTNNKFTQRTLSLITMHSSEPYHNNLDMFHMRGQYIHTKCVIQNICGYKFLVGIIFGEHLSCGI